MKVSGSILAVKSDYFAYAEILKFAKIDCLHVDIFQDEKEFSVADILRFDDTYPPLDVHLIFESVSDEYIDILNQANVRYLNVQYENLLNKDDTANAEVIIEDDVMIASNVVVKVMNYHSIYSVEDGKRLPNKNLRIGAHVWLDFNSTIYAGGVIGAGSVIGAGRDRCGQRDSRYSS